MKQLCTMLVTYCSPCGAAGVAGFHSAIPSTFANEPEPNNPIRAIFFNGYNDQGSPPDEVTTFEVWLHCTSQQCYCEAD